MILRFPGARNCRIMVLAAVMTAVPMTAFAQNNTQVVPPPKAQKKLPEAPSKLPQVGADRTNASVAAFVFAPFVRGGQIEIPADTEFFAKVAQDTLLPNLDRGPGNTDINHRFVFSGVWDLNYARQIANRWGGG